MTAGTSATGAALGAATETLLNCYLREADGWRIEGGRLMIGLPGTGVEIRARLRHRSRTHRHRYHLPVEMVSGGQARPVTFPALAGLLLDALEHRRPGGRTAAPTVLLARMLESVHNVAEFLEHRRDEVDHLWSAAPLTFIESEQALLLGHPLHPTPKSREPMTAADRPRYSPETRGRFPLRWLAVAPDVLRHDSALGVPAPVLANELAGRCGLPDLPAGGDRVHLPAHPWQLDHLKDRPEVAALFAQGTLADLGSRGDPVTPTTSVRTVYRDDWPWQLKFSLDVRVTNSKRVSLPRELDRAVEAARLWQTDVGTAAARIAPGFACIHDPAYLAIVPDGQPLDGLSVLFRTNRWGAGNRMDVTSVTSLCQDHPFGGPSRLARIVERTARREGRAVTDAGRAWFDAFLRVAVVSLVRLYTELGLCFEPHQQNTLLELDGNGMPARCVYRDSQGYFHRELAHRDLTAVLPGLGEATDSVFPETLADERLTYYPFLNLTLGVVDALGAAGCADEDLLLGDLRRCLDAERGRGTRYPPTLLDRLLDDDRWPCKGNLRTRWHDMDELVGDIADQSVYVAVPNPLRAPEVLP